MPAVQRPRRLYSLRRNPRYDHGGERLFRHNSGAKTNGRRRCAWRASRSGDGIRAKQRSVHNTYFTLPVLFVMTSNHYAMTYSHAYNWAISDCHYDGRCVDPGVFRRTHKGRCIAAPDSHRLRHIGRSCCSDCPQIASATATATCFIEWSCAVVHHRCTPAIPASRHILPFRRRRPA